MKRAIDNDQVLISALNKLVPNKTQIGIGPEDINHVIEAVSDIICRHVKDPDTLKAICEEMRELELKSQF